MDNLFWRYARRAGLGGYDSKVLGTGPIAYWPQSESTGTTAHCLVNPAQNGTYTAVTLANDLTGPFGTPAPWYDGATSYCTVHSAPLVAAFNGAEGSAMIWAKVANVGVWTDAAIREAFRLLVDGNNLIIDRIGDANNTMGWYYFAGGETDTHFMGALTTTGWMCLATAWSDVANLVSSYYNGALHSSTAANTPWVGALAAAFIGAESAVASWWHGWLGPYALWDRALSAGEIMDLASV